MDNDLIQRKRFWIIWALAVIQFPTGLNIAICPPLKEADK